jgi:hypothetical protein
MRIPGFKMRGSGWQAIWTFIAILAAVRTLSELFRHGWSDLILIGLLCFAAATGFALLARRTRAEFPEDSESFTSIPRRREALRGRPSDPILPGRRFF